MVFAFSEKISCKLHLQETPPHVFIIYLKTKRFSEFLIWGGRSLHISSNTTQIFLGKFQVVGFSNSHNLIPLAKKLSMLCFRLFWLENRLQLRTKYMKQTEEIKQNQTGTGNFDICFCEIFDRISFIWWLGDLYPFLRFFKYFLISKITKS